MKLTIAVFFALGLTLLTFRSASSAAFNLGTPQGPPPVDSAATSYVVQLDTDRATSWIVNYDDQIFSNEMTNPTLNLRQKLAESLAISSQNYDLISVTLVAKSYRGRATADFLIGKKQVDRQNVRGDSETWNDNSSSTYDRVRMDNPSMQSEGAWQITLHGTVKVKKVILNVRRHLNRETFTKDLECGDAFQSRTCSLALPKGSQISEVTVLNEISAERCIEGQNWWFNSSAIEVAGGCHAIFRLTLLK